MIRLAVYFDPPEDFITHLGNISDNIQINVCTNRDDLKNCLPETEILVTLLSWPDAEMIRLASKLRWIQALTAGVDIFPLSEIQEQGIILTCGRGIHKIYIAEYAISAMINLARNFHLMFNNQLKAKWDRSLPQEEIHGRVAGIIGLGSIGQEIARKASILGMRVIGVKNNPQPLEGVDQVYGPSEMKEVFQQSDYVINLLPGAPATRGLIDKKFFNSMRRSACFIGLIDGGSSPQVDKTG